MCSVPSHAPLLWLPLLSHRTTTLPLHGRCSRTSGTTFCTTCRPRYAVQCLHHAPPAHTQSAQGQGPGFVKLSFQQAHSATLNLSGYQVRGYRRMCACLLAWTVSADTALSPPCTALSPPPCTALSPPPPCTALCLGPGVAAQGGDRRGAVHRHEAGEATREVQAPVGKGERGNVAGLTACCLWVDSLHSASMHCCVACDLMPASQMLPTAAN